MKRVVRTVGLVRMCKEPFHLLLFSFSSCFRSLIVFVLFLILCSSCFRALLIFVFFLFITCDVSSFYVMMIAGGLDSCLGHLFRFVYSKVDLLENRLLE